MPAPPNFVPLLHQVDVNTKPGWESPPQAMDPKMGREHVGKGEAVKTSHPQARDGSRVTTYSLATHCGES